MNKHDFDSVDTEGHVMECTVCGRHICIYEADDWDKGLDEGCSGKPEKWY